MRQVPIEAGAHAPGGVTNVYVDDEVLVDPGAESPELEDAVARAEPAHVAVTHHHPDHAAAVAAYAETFGLTVWARAGRTDAFEAATGVSPDRTFGPGDGLPIEGMEVLDTPGHAPEHVAFVTDEGVVSGDLAVAEGSVVVGAPEGDMRAYLTSLRRLHARAPERLFPGHGPVIDDPQATCRRLLAHRLDRERAVEQAVERGGETPDDLVDAAYEKDVSGVRALARATVVAHLEKLAVEGRVRWDGTTALPAEG